MQALPVELFTSEGKAHQFYMHSLWLLLGAGWQTHGAGLVACAVSAGGLGWHLAREGASSTIARPAPALMCNQHGARVQPDVASLPIPGPRHI